MMLAGVLDIEASRRAARFVRTCDAFNIPLLTFVTCPASCPASTRSTAASSATGEAALRLLRGHRALHPGDHPEGLRRRLRRHERQVDRRRPGLRSALGRAGGDGPPRRGRDRVHRRELSTAADPEARRAELVEEYTERFTNPYIAAERGMVDDVIDPAETRRKVIAGFEMLRSKRESSPSASTERPL